MQTERGRKRYRQSKKEKWRPRVEGRATETEKVEERGNDTERGRKRN
jgi:hypothetical protein